ncbi:MAG: T9SS type A sorting domain-containing protein, partial [Bacteroidales bacterium]|nr:T9SS type A sorting domain-containing protein [Bacteroidales bacterium]
EFVIDCGNPYLSDYSSRYFKKISAKTTVSDTLELPFFDDFSASHVYPDSTKWTDKYAFINNAYCSNPISYGVASLDAINQYGAVYPHLPIGMSEIADYLTSKPINLERNAEDSIYLSFFYQCGGKGNTPENRDSLVVQFYSVEDDEWTSVWHVAGGSNMDNFEMVLIPIADEIWLKKGFQFRFLNYASISSNYEPSWQSNADIWNIDFVFIDANRNINDTIVEDVTMAKNVGPFLKKFSSMPWSHFLEISDKNSIIHDSISFVYNNWQQTQQNINRQYDVFDASETSSLITAREYIDNHCGDDSENAEPNSSTEYRKRFCYKFNEESYNLLDSATFLIRANIKTDNVQEREFYRWNDTVRYYQEFKNYYSYDDGTAEKGYGISGQGTANSSLAYQFESYKTDTLFGAYIYFNRTLNDGNQKYFYLTVWEDNNGEPGDTIVSRMGVRPIFSNEINGFIYYPLDTAIVIQKNTKFYVGWIKTTNDMLNCGLDTDTDAHEHIYFNVSGYWEQSIISGALMIRPVFGYEIRHHMHIPTQQMASDFEVYPNPAQDMIYISSDTEYDSISIFDNLGRLVKTASHEAAISVSDLPQGTYFVKPLSERNIFNTQKILIMR